MTSSSETSRAIKTMTGIYLSVYRRKERHIFRQVRDYFSSVWKISDCKLYGKSPIWKWNPSVKTAEGELRRRYKEIAKEHPDWIMEKDYFSHIYRTVAYRTSSFCIPVSYCGFAVNAGTRMRKWMNLAWLTLSNT